MGEEKQRKKNAGRYRKVSVRIWNDKKFRSLSDDAQMVFFLLLTHPNMTALGIMRHTLSGLAEEKGWDVERLSKAFQEGLSKGMIRHSKDDFCIALPNFIKHNIPENPNVVLSWSKVLDLIPECSLKYEQIQINIDYVKWCVEVDKSLSEAFLKPLESLSKGIEKQEQEQEQEQDKKKHAQEAEPPASFESRHWEKKIVGEMLNEIQNVRDELVFDYKLNKIDVWIQTKVNINGHPKAILHCLRRLLNEWAAGNVKNPWGYLESIFSVENGNYNEQDGIAFHEKMKSIDPDCVKNFNIASMIKKIAEKSDAGFGCEYQS